MQQLSPLLAEAEALVLASPIYYFGMSAQIQAPIQRVYNVNKPANVIPMARQQLLPKTLTQILSVSMRSAMFSR